MTVIDTPQDINRFRVAALICSLQIEVKTGMKMSRGVSPLKIAKVQYGCPKNTKAGALAWLEEQYEEAYGRPYGA